MQVLRIGMPRRWVHVLDRSGAGGIAALTTVLSIGSQAIPAALLPVVVRRLAPGEYGRYALMLSASTLLAAALTLSLQTALPSLISGRDPSEPVVRRDVGSLVVLQGLVASALAAAALLGGGPLWRIGFHEEPWPSMQLAIGLGVTSSLTAMAGAALAIQGRAPQAAAISLGRACLASLLMVLVLQPGASAPQLALLHVIAGSLAVVATWFSLRSSGVTLQLPTRALTSSSLLVALPFVPHAVGAWFTDASDRIILMRHVSPAELDAYALGYGMAALLGTAVVAANQAWMPRYLSGRSDLALRQATDGSLYRALGFLTAGMVAALPVLRPGIAAIFGQQFESAALTVGLVATYQVATALYFVTTAPLWKEHRARRLAPLSLGISAASVVANLLLVPRWGALAAALVTAFSGLAWFVGGHLIARYAVGLETPWVRSCIVLFAMGAAAVVCGRSENAGTRCASAFALALVLVTTDLPRLGGAGALTPRRPGTLRTGPSQ